MTLSAENETSTQSVYQFFGFMWISNTQISEIQSQKNKVFWHCSCRVPRFTVSIVVLLLECNRAWERPACWGLGAIMRVPSVTAVWRGGGGGGGVLAWRSLAHVYEWWVWEGATQKQLIRPDVWMYWTTCLKLLQYFALILQICQRKCPFSLSATINRCLPRRSLNCILIYSQMCMCGFLF